MEKILFIAFELFGIWIFFDLIVFSRLNGKVKRGVPITSTKLSEKLYDFLKNIKSDYIEYNFFNFPLAFVKIEDKKILIRGRALPGWPMIGYIDLNSSEPSIQFRIPLGLFLLTLMMTLTIIGAPIILFINWIIFIIHKRSILNLIEEISST